MENSIQAKKQWPLWVKFGFWFAIVSFVVSFASVFFRISVLNVFGLMASYFLIESGLLEGFFDNLPIGFMVIYLLLSIALAFLVGALVGYVISIFKKAKKYDAQ